MKQKFLLATTALLYLAVACTSSKKSISSNSPNTATSQKPKNGVYSPNNEELLAIQKQDPAMSIGKLQEGYSIYKGACTGCHGLKNIYRFSVSEWKEIIDDMAPKARLNDLQKDAVYKYVLAIKATQNQ